MANTLRFKRGLASGIPTAVAGEPLFTTDTFDLYIGNGTGNTRFQKYIASGTTSQLLRGDGSLLTMPIVLTSPSNGQVLKFNGTNWVNDSDSGITGSLTTNYLPKATGATTLGNSLIFDDGTNLAIGTTSPTAKLSIKTNSSLTKQLDFGYSSSFGVNYIESYDTVSGNAPLLLYTTQSGSYISFYVGSTTTERARIFGTGNFGIGTGATDSGQRLQVIGDTLLKGSGSTSATNALLIENSAGTDMWRFLNDGQLLLGSNASGAVIHPSGTDGILNIGGLNTTFYTSVITQAFGTGAFHFWGTTLQSTSGFNTHVSITRQFAPTSGTAQMYYLLVSPVINQTGGANGITRGLYVNPTLTAAADWRSIEWSNNTGWGLYGTGTAPNLLNGNLLIGSTNNFASLYIQRNTSAASNQGIFFAQTPIVGAITDTIFNYGSSFINQNAVNLANAVHYSATQGILTTSTITNQFGFRAANLTAGTNNYGFYGDLVASGTARWNLFMNGTAPNYLNGELLVGSTSNSGEKLQVTGNTLLKGSGNTSATTALTVQNSASTNMFRVRNDGFTLTNFGTFIGSSESNVIAASDATGTSSASGLNLKLLFGSFNTAGYGLLIAGYNTSTRTATSGASGTLSLEHGFAPTSGTGTFTMLQTSGTINQVGATGITRGLYVNPTLTAAADWRSIEWSNNSGWGLYGAGTANNYLGGNLGIGITPTERLHVSGNAIITGITTTSSYINVNTTNGFTVGALLNRRRIQYGSDDATSFSLLNDSNGFAGLYGSKGVFSESIAIGTTPDSNNPFKVLKNLNSTVGIRFENTNTSSAAFSAIQFGTDVSGGTKFGNLVYASSGVSQTGAYYPDGTSLINTGSGGLNFLAVSQPIRFFTSTGNGTLRAAITNDGDFTQYNGTNPSASTTDAFRMYSADVTAGNAAPHFRTENGAVIKLYQETTAVGNAIISLGGGNAVLDDTTFDGYTLRQIVKALRNQGILA